MYADILSWQALVAGWCFCQLSLFWFLGCWVTHEQLHQKTQGTVLYSPRGGCSTFSSTHYQLSCRRCPWERSVVGVELVCKDWMTVTWCCEGVWKSSIWALPVHWVVGCNYTFSDPIQQCYTMLPYYIIPRITHKLFPMVCYMLQVSYGKVKYLGIIKKMLTGCLSSRTFRTCQDTAKLTIHWAKDRERKGRVCVCVLLRCETYLRLVAPLPARRLLRREGLRAHM